MAGHDLTRRVAETYDDYLALGCDVRDHADLRIVSCDDAPQIYDANYGSRVRAETDAEIDSVLERFEKAFAGAGHRHFICDPDTPPAFEARLVLDGYEPQQDLELVLEEELRASPPKIDLRLVESETDWRIVLQLMTLDYAEVAMREKREPYPKEVMRQFSGVNRRKAPAVRTWLAHVDRTDCGYLSSFPGNNGVGMVEDLFTHPDFRHRGIATELIAHAVADARERGAGPVLIGARTNDTPRHMYAELGFRPLYLQRGYLKKNLEA